VGILFILFNQTFSSEPVRPEWRLRYLDALTGLEVEPDHIEGVPMPRSGVAVAGLRSIRVTARGYENLQSSLVVPDGAPSGKLRMWLDPVSIPHRLTRDSILERTGNTRMLFHGFVVADDSGRPLGGATISIESMEESAVVAPDGYFELLVPVSAKAGDTERRTLLISADGYMVRRMDGLEAWRGGDWLMKARLLTESGIQAANGTYRQSTMETPLDKQNLIYRTRTNK